MIRPSFEYESLPLLLRRLADCSKSRRTDMDGMIRALVKCVRRRIRADEEVTVEAVTKELGFTRQYVSGRFHRTTGRLLSHFLKEKRLEKAARLLKAGNLRVSMIARRCGFDSENYFRQQFRERFGMSPRQFRSNGLLRMIRRPRVA
jgi:AraC-like DNA-binding protein